jgi:hypothetical protein
MQGRVRVRAQVRGRRLLLRGQLLLRLQLPRRRGQLLLMVVRGRLVWGRLWRGRLMLLLQRPRLPRWRSPRPLPQSWTARWAA